ncbi:IclR family transcriptional regulator [Marinobacterium rhizophilum]|uniref:Helix-turn-helix domain-containing protein n=1 Tax=Marinobacterium rhizophilum TaxID=420402 RepID=A0ABY5HMI0_9GAMM|nr:helix-turn-helix domain-containing protein [Marinobacterium rhizophilum]UTW12798.1 helix-turn-helix domain-containing protein [Marinobacterium rhizophilum]
MTPAKTSPPSATETSRQGIGSLEIGLRVLNEIARSATPLSLKDLSLRLDLSSSRLHKYLISLVRMQYIVQGPNARYSLATASLSLGMAALKRIDPMPITFDAAARLHQATDRTLSVAIWNGKMPLIVNWLDSSQVLAVNVRLGSELSPFFSAAGRLFLAYLPAERQRRIVDDFYQAPSALPRYQGRQLQRQDFYSLLKATRNNAQACFYGDFLPDINVISSPVFNLGGQIQAVISLMGMASDTDVRPGQRLERLLSATTRGTTKLICGNAV